MKQLCPIICLFLAACSEKPDTGLNKNKREKEISGQIPAKDYVLNEEEQFRDVFRQARSGDSNAQFDLFVKYRTGKTEGGPFPKNPKKSIQWLSLAAENGNKNAQFELAECYEKGIGLPKNPESAMRWYKKSAEGGKARAFGKIGDMYFYGVGRPIDYGSAIEAYQKGVALFDPYSANQLASCYNEGLGTDIDLVQAFEGYKKSLELAEREIADTSDPSQEQLNELSIIRCNYATCLLFGEGTQRNIEMAIYELTQSARHNNYLANLYLEDLAAGDSMVAEQLNGLKNPQNPTSVEEPKTGLRTKEIYRLSFAKKEEDSDSQSGRLSEIGYRTWYGYGIKRDLFRARELFSGAHELGDPEGSRNYALTWFEFAWADQSDAEDRFYGLEILKEAAKKGDSRAGEILKGPFWRALDSKKRIDPSEAAVNKNPRKANLPIVERNK